MNLGAIQISVRNSIGTRLFLYVLCGALIGLGSMSYLFYQVLESQARTEMISHLETQAALVEGQLSRVTQFLSDSIATIEVMHEIAQNDSETYKEAVLELYQNRPPIALGAGVCQAPFQLTADRALYYPYFFLDQDTPNQIGQPLPPPYADTRFVDIAQVEDYTQKEYYLTPVAVQEPVWLEPYAWNDLTMTSLVSPIYSRQSAGGEKPPLLGLMGVDISVTALSQQMNLSLFKNSGYIAIFSERGNLLAYPPDPQQAKSLSTYESVPQLGRVWPQVNAAPSGLIQANGMYWIYQRIEGTRWLMLEVVPQWSILRPVLLIAIGGAIGAGGILAVVVSVFIRRLNQRLRPILDQCDGLIATDIDRSERLNLQRLNPVLEESQLALSIQNKDELDILELLFAHMVEQLQASFRELEQRVADRTEALSTALAQLKKSQLQLVQTEKMSSLSQLVAGIAHEINNPINFIHGNVSHVDAYAHDLLHLVHLYGNHFPQPPAEIQTKITEIDLEFLESDLKKALQSMQMGTDRIRDIVRSLRNFSRLDESEIKDVDIHEGIDSAIAILQNRLRAKSDRPGIQIIKEYGVLPLVECHAGQLNQVFMNILINAIDALEERDQLRSAEEIKADPSTIRIWTSKVGSCVAIHFSDNGIGMSETVREQIFDPFFTTKPVGKGTGMGLSISYQIITGQHKGRLRCESILGKGTKIMIEIPSRQTTATCLAEEYIAGVAPQRVNQIIRATAS